MSLAKKFAYNSFIQIAGKALSVFLGLLGVALITRYLGVTGFGRYTALNNFLGIFAVLADLGLTMVTAQMINEKFNERSKILNNLLGFRLFSAGAIIGLGLLVALLLPYYRSLWLILAILGGSYFLIALIQILTGLLQSELRSDYLMIAEVTGRFVWLIGLWFTRAYGWGLLGVAIATIVSSLLHFLIAWRLSDRQVKIRPTYDKTLWREIAVRSWPLAVTIALNLLYLRTDILFLTWFQGERVVGLYGAAYKVIDVLTSLPFLIVGLLLPLLTRAWSSGEKKRFAFLTNTALSVLLMIIIPLIIGGQLLSGPIINLIAGSDFAQAGPILALLLLAIAGIFASCLFNHILIAVNQQKVMVAPYAFVALTALPAYYFLVKIWSYWGAAGVTVYSEVLIAIMTAYYAKKKAGWNWPWLTMLKAIVASIIMVVLVWPCLNFANQGGFQLMLVVFWSIIVYGLGLWLLGGFKIKYYEAAHSS
ncbi:MAG TPA: oligosaccharide flippase family protein [bacterium]|nr:oligosaccharide flippase family protein [bacterium]